jgi:hypothetical protein
MRSTGWILGAALLLAVAMPAHAWQCPADMAKIDAALDAGVEISDEELARVQELRAEGEQLHGAGNHEQSVAALAEAMEILGIE